MAYKVPVAPASISLKLRREALRLLDGPAEPFAELLTKAGFVHDPIRREFVREGLPVHLVLLDQLGMSPGRRIEVDGVATVSLADLIAMEPHPDQALDMSMNTFEGRSLAPTFAG